MNCRCRLCSASSHQRFYRHSGAFYRHSGEGRNPGNFEAQPHLLLDPGLRRDDERLRRDDERLRRHGDKMPDLTATIVAMGRMPCADSFRLIGNSYFGLTPSLAPLLTIGITALGG
jgi:hypothetical protein